MVGIDKLDFLKFNMQLCYENKKTEEQILKGVADCCFENLNGNKSENKLFAKDYDRIKIITVDQILRGEIFDVPKTHELSVVKSAQAKENNIGQEKLDF